MNHLLNARGLTEQISCDSAGTSGYHAGSAPDRRMTLAAQRKGIMLTGSSRQFTKRDFEDFDIILAMDESNYRDILAMDPNQRFAHKVKLMCDFCQDHSDREVPDPYYGGEAGFDYVIELLTDACEGLLNDIS